MIRLPLAPGSETPLSPDVKLGRISEELYRFFSALIAALNNRVAVTGSVTFAAATTAAVSFSVAEASAEYDVWFSPTSNLVHWASSKTTAGFVANSSSSTSDEIRWMLVRR